MVGDRQNHKEFTIERDLEQDVSGGRSSPRGGASNEPPGKGQAEFDLKGSGERQLESGIPDRLRRKYYIAEAVAGDEAKAYADPRGEYLAFKVSAERMATRLEDAGVIRDMVSIAQHRSWSEVELRGSEEFRRTAWLEASVRSLSVRGYEPNSVDRAALSVRTNAAGRPMRAPSQSLRPETEASEAISVAGISTRRPIDVTALPPMTIDAVPLQSATPDQTSRTAGKRRAEMFRAGDRQTSGGDDIVKAARSQLAAIERALSKAVRDPELRRSVLTYAKERIAERLGRGTAFVHAELRERTIHRPDSPDRGFYSTGQKGSNDLDIYQQR